MMNYHIRVRASALIVERDSVLLIQFNDENGLHKTLVLRDELADRT
jgi:8-oxo-dGTP diphosphatase